MARFTTSIVLFTLTEWTVGFTPACPENYSFRALQKILDDESLKLLEPPEEPTQVTAGFLLSAVSTVDDLNGFATARMVLVQYWTDPRLVVTCRQNATTVIEEEMMGKFWDGLRLSIQDAVDGDQVAVLDSTTRMHVDGYGNIKLMKIFKVKAICTGNYINWPFDSIVCEMYVVNKRPPYQTSVEWVNGSVVSVPPWFASPSYDVVRPTTAYELSTDNDGHPYSPGRITKVGNMRSWWTFVCLRRRYAVFFCSIYIPHFVVFGVAWAALFLPPPPDQGRLGIGVSMLLVMMVSFSTITRFLPGNSEMVAIDFWLIWNVFVHLLLVAVFFAVSSIAKSVERLEAELEVAKSGETKKTAGDVLLVDFERDRQAKIASLIRARKRRMSLVDNATRWGIGVLYVGLAGVYFWWNLVYHQPDVIQQRYKGAFS